MRLLLFIPAFILFLANIPFQFEMKMEKAVCEKMKDDDCPMKHQMNSKKSCHKADAYSKPSCHKKPAATDNKNDKENPCDASTGITCVCICCFNYTAPGSTFAAPNFSLIPQENILTGFIHSIWEDPQLSPPWQPPDVV